MKKTLMIVSGVVAFSNLLATPSFSDKCEQALVSCKKSYNEVMGLKENNILACYDCLKNCINAAEESCTGPEDTFNKNKLIAYGKQCASSKYCSINKTEK